MLNFKTNTNKLIHKIMKKSIFLLSFTVLTLTGVVAQNTGKKQNLKAVSEPEVKKVPYNKWSIEASAGQSIGIAPFTAGYYSSNPNVLLGNVTINSFSIGTRCMFSPVFGLKADITSDRLQNNTKTDSKTFDLQQYRFGFQGVINAARLFDVSDKFKRFNFLIHAGGQVAMVTPKFEDALDPANNYNRTERDLGLVFGISPEFRITNKLSFLTDISILSNYRQHFAWDGHSAEFSNTNLSGSMMNMSVGVSYSFGKDNIHGDWAVIVDKKQEAINDLNKKLTDIETMMNDTDKDGVPDYLDAENNSIAGVAVDTKGRMVDKNNNGVPDQLENYLATTYADKGVVDGMSKLIPTNSDIIKNYINEGYVAAYFDLGKTAPTNISTQGVGFILNYLRANPTATIDIIGYADELGANANNTKLATDRANNIKNTLIKAKVDAARMNVVSKGEDNSVEKKSSDARRLVRRVVFMVK